VSAGRSKYSKALPPAQLKKFRAQISILKKNGLIRKSVDARSVTPTAALKAAVRKYASVISGKSKVVTVKPAIAKKLARSGYQTPKPNRVIISKKQKINSKGIITRTSPTPQGNVVQIDLPADKSTLLAFLTDLKTRDNEFLKYKPKGYRLGFTFFGNRSYATYQNFEQISNSLFNSYDRIQRAFEEDDTDMMMEILSNISIYGIRNRQYWPPNPKGSRHWRYSEKRRQRNQLYRQKIKKYPRAYARFQASKKASAKRYRQAHKDEIRRKQRAYRKAHKRNYKTILKESGR
jgi:hypothetical protein